ncbi:MAG: hypothetical protein M5U26_20805 [Planctomycetota bacterium]|nr:hypothetical protein [Planctomycetota bacterium]
MNRSAIPCLILAVALAPGLVSAGEAAPAPTPAPVPKEAPAPKAEPSPDEPNDPPDEKQPASIYAALGGSSKIAVITVALLAAVEADPVLAAHPALKKALAEASRPHLQFQLTNLLCAMAGGPERYTGAPLAPLYKELDPSDKEWNALTALFEKLLDAQGVAADVKAAWLANYAKVRQVLLASDDRPAPWRNEARRVGLELPRSWERKEGAGDTLLTAMSPALDAKDGYRENLNLVVQALPVEMNAAEYGKTWLFMGAKQLVEFKALGHGPVTLDGKTLYRIEYAGRMGTLNLTVIGYCAVRGTEGVALTFVSVTEQAESFKPVFEGIAKTLKLE